VNTPVWNAAPDGGGGAPEARHCPNPAHGGGCYQRRKGKSRRKGKPKGRAGSVWGVSGHTSPFAAGSNARQDPSRASGSTVSPQSRLPAPACCLAPADRPPRQAGQRPVRRSTPGGWHPWAGRGGFVASPARLSSRRSLGLSPSALLGTLSPTMGSGRRLG
jgi:hypothetical protein